MNKTALGVSIGLAVLSIVLWISINPFSSYVLSKSASSAAEDIAKKAVNTVTKGNPDAPPEDTITLTHQTRESVFNKTFVLEPNVPRTYHITFKSTGFSLAGVFDTDVTDVRDVVTVTLTTNNPNDINNMRYTLATGCPIEMRCLYTLPDSQFIMPALGPDHILSMTFMKKGTNDAHVTVNLDAVHTIEESIPASQYDKERSS